MSVIHKLSITFLSILIFTGCSSKTTGLDDSGNSGESTDPAKQEDRSADGKPAQYNDMDLADYFLPDTSKAHFQGEENKIANLDIDYAQPYKNYVIVHESYNGTLTRYIYKIEDDQILQLNQRVVELKEDFPSLEEVEKMESNGIYLKKPFEVGTKFDDWEIVETGIKVETPYQTFENAFVIETMSQNALIRKYFVEGFGEVKRESVMNTTDGDKVQDTSVLSSVTKP